MSDTSPMIAGVPFDTISEREPLFAVLSKKLVNLRIDGWQPGKVVPDIDLVECRIITDDEFARLTANDHRPDVFDAMLTAGDLTDESDARCLTQRMIADKRDDVT